MKCMVLTGLKRMAPAKRPPPRIRGANDVLLRVDVVGVCGSDVHYYRDGRIGSQQVTYPFVVGHECSATVLRTGSAVKGLRPGRRVAVEPGISCRRCDQCLDGRPHTCRRMRYLGCPGQRAGCLAERLVMPAANCFPVPKQMTAEQSAFVEPLSIGCYAAGLARSLKGRRAAILGAGPIGLSVLLALRDANPDLLCVTEPLAARRKAAARLGAAWCGDPYASHTEAALRRCAPHGFDAIFECCGKQEALDQAMRLLKPGGELLIAGIPPVERISFPVDTMRHNEITIKNVRRQNGCVPRAMALAARYAHDIDMLITHRFPMEQSGKAFDLAAVYGDGMIKAMICLS